MITSHFKKHPKKMAAQENGQRCLCIAPTKWSRGYACPLHANDNQGRQWVSGLRADRIFSTDHHQRVIAHLRLP